MNTEFEPIGKIFWDIQKDLLVVEGVSYIKRYDIWKRVFNSVWTKGVIKVRHELIQVMIS